MPYSMVACPYFRHRNRRIHLSIQVRGQVSEHVTAGLICPSQSGLTPYELCRGSESCSHRAEGSMQRVLCALGHERSA